MHIAVVRTNVHVAYYCTIYYHFYASGRDKEMQLCKTMQTIY